jgi:hypothetical protein
VATPNERLRPATTIGRIGVALAASNPQRVYTIVNQTNGPFQGFYRSDDGGTVVQSLPQLDLSGAQSTYGWWFVGYGSTSDQAHVFAAGVLCESQNSGVSFTGQSSRTPTITPWSGT